MSQLRNFRFKPSKLMEELETMEGSESKNSTSEFASKSDLQNLKNRVVEISQKLTQNPAKDSEEMSSLKSVLDSMSDKLNAVLHDGDVVENESDKTSESITETMTSVPLSNNSQNSRTENIVCKVPIEKASKLIEASDQSYCRPCPKRHKKLHTQIHGKVKIRRQN